MLEPYRPVIGQQQLAVETIQKQLLAGKSLSDFSLGHRYFGLHESDNNWTIREWAPGASRIYLISEFNNWQETDDAQFHKLDGGKWELILDRNKLAHGRHYKLRVYWPGGSGDRLPSYTNYAVQDTDSLVFDAVVWSPKKPYVWQDHNFLPPSGPPLIYEAHVGMSSQEPAIASYQYFTDQILPRIKNAGYNTVQLMAVQEHPYYGSFGYHVSNFFAASSRFGTPDDLKRLVDTAHKLGLRIIMDIVHSHAASNEIEGLSRFDGQLNQYFLAGTRGRHPAWDSRVFDYGKPEVFHFLLSNCRFWMEDYHFDGFRFDGVTSMLYKDHGLGRHFNSYDDYYSQDINIEALTYLKSANELIHSIKPEALTIAEDMSGFPGLAAPVKNGGYGFDYRLSMGVPDIWIKTLKESRDEDWNLGKLFYELTTKRPEEKVISYSESHDQALVGDQTLIFRLIGQEIYDHMNVADDNLAVERGMALVKLIRLLTSACHGGGYLNFMGNEFGHPEWIDFPRAGNDWSYAHARRQWSLADNKTLKYSQLGAFDQALTSLIGQLGGPVEYIYIKQKDHVISFLRNEYLLAFNFAPDKSVVDYALPAPVGSYEVAFSSDDLEFGGQGRIDKATKYQTLANNKGASLMVYLPARSGLVLKKHSPAV